VPSISVLFEYALANAGRESGQIASHILRHAAVCEMDFLPINHDLSITRCWVKRCFRVNLDILNPGVLSRGDAILLQLNNI